MIVITKEYGHDAEQNMMDDTDYAVRALCPLVTVPIPVAGSLGGHTWIDHMECMQFM